MLWPLRLAIRVVAGIVVIALVYFGVTFAQVWQASRRDEAARAQAIVVFGAAQYDGVPSPVLRARLDHAAALWERELAPVIAVTGGKAPGDRFTEAQASADYLMRLGVPDEAILREVSGRNSWESLAATAHFLQDRAITSVLLVSDGFHAARIKGMADELGLSARVSPVEDSPISGSVELKQMVKETVAVGLARFLGYRRLMRVDRVVVKARESATLTRARSGVV